MVHKCNTYLPPFLSSYIYSFSLLIFLFLYGGVCGFSYMTVILFMF